MPASHVTRQTVPSTYDFWRNDREVSVEEQESWSIERLSPVINIQLIILILLIKNNQIVVPAAVIVTDNVIVCDAHVMPADSSVTLCFANVVR